MATTSKAESSERSLLEAGTKVGNFEIMKFIASGGYGECYMVRNTEDGSIAAVKIEYLKRKRIILVHERNIMMRYQDSLYFPKIIVEGKTSDFAYLVMELLGPSLSMARRIAPKHRFAPYSVIRSSLEMLNCIYAYHKEGFTHRDIKPANFLIRADRKFPIVLIDYGLSIPYVDHDGRHIKFKADAGFTGTYRYASLNAHDGIELSRRDDLLSWFYSVIELANGRLPWPGSQDKAKTERMKREMSPSDLCANLPLEFIEIFSMLNMTEFDEMPNYAGIAKLITKALDHGDFPSIEFDWATIPEDRIATVSNVCLTNLEGKPKLYEICEAIDSTRRPSCCEVV